MFDRVRKFLKENPRAWMVFAAAGLVSLVVVWGVYGGFSLGFSRFFASEVCPLTPQGNTIVKPVLRVECGPSQNVLTWTNTEAIEAVVVELQRNAYIPAPIIYDPEETTTLTTENGCTGTFRINSYVDTTARPGLINNYVIQVGGRQGGWTNVVSCTPAPTPASTPVATVASVPGADAATLSVQCGTVHNVLTWTLAPGRDSNAILRNVDGADATYVCGGPTGIAPCTNTNATTFTDTVQAGRAYTYTHKSCAPPTCRSNSVTCPAVTANATAPPTATTNPVLTPTPTPTITPTPTPSPSPTVPPSLSPPTAGTLTCSPQQQTVTVGGMSEHSAQGGDGVNYRWDVSPGAVKQDGVSNFVIYSWLTPGVKSVTVTSDGDQATCIVNVQDAAAAAVTLSASKEVRNVTAGHVNFAPSTSVWKNHAVDFSLRVAPTSVVESGPYVVTDTLPSGMTYMVGSTRLNGGPFGDPTQTAEGLIFPPFPVGLGTAATLEYRAMSDRFEVDLSPPESRAIEMTATDQGSGSTARAAVTLILYGRGPATDPAPGGPGIIPTGPGDAVTFALIAAVVSSLLYAAYTRSAAFRSREVRRIESDQGPMDFRS